MLGALLVMGVAEARIRSDVVDDRSNTAVDDCRNTLHNALIGF